jgi:hypothetical protein
MTLWGLGLTTPTPRFLCVDRGRLSFAGGLIGRFLVLVLPLVILRSSGLLLWLFVIDNAAVISS